MLVNGLPVRFIEQAGPVKSSSWLLGPYKGTPGLCLKVISELVLIDEGRR